MDFTWDENKAESNFAKHGVRFEVAVNVFFDPAKFTYIDTRRDYGEVRENSIGMVEGETILLVTHTARDGITRLISARRANKKERTQYHGQNH